MADGILGLGSGTYATSIPGQYSVSGIRAPTSWESAIIPGLTITGVSQRTLVTPMLSSPGAVAASTGVNPTETSYSLYGHTIPLSVFGVGRIGGEIISGPWVENGNATFCISFGVPADPTGTRDLREIAFDSEVVWTAADGFSAEGFTYRFYGGTLTQAADPLEISHFGADAIAYRPQILIWFENLPLSYTKFGKIPYVAAVIGDASGDDVNLGEAFERLAYSPWVGYTSAQFETSGITDGLVDGGLIIAEPAEFLATIQQFGRFYRNWDILQTDKLRIVDRGATVTPDITFDKTGLMDQVTFARAEPNSVPRELELSTIDPEADYTIVPSKASRPRDPVNVSASVATESAYLPMIMDSSTRMSLVTYTKYQEEVARKKVSGKAMIYGLELEPGDLVGLTGLGDDFRNEVFKVVETLHGANHVVEFTAESFLNCEIPPDSDPYIEYVVLLLGFEDVDGSTGDPGFTDESPAAHGTATPITDAQIDTAQSKFGSASLLIDGADPAIRFGGSLDWCLSSSNSDQFTVECWVRLNALPAGIGVLVAQTLTVTSWYLGVASDGEFRFRSSATGILGDYSASVYSSGAALATNTWYHLAVDKDATGKIRLYKDGVMVGSDTPADSSIYSSVDTLEIGNAGLFGGNAPDGWIDEMRITKGIARYASDGGYVVPTAAFPREEDF
jgi:hypothetical protein